MIRRIVTSAAFAAGIAALSPAAEAQYSPWCNPFPLTWPFCIVGGAAMIVTAPFRAFAPPPPPPYYYGYYRYPPYYPPPAAYGAQPSTAAPSAAPGTPAPAYSSQPAPTYSAPSSSGAATYGEQPTPLAPSYYPGQR